MTIIAPEEEIEKIGDELAGAKLAALRMQKGYSTEFVAGKLCLRKRIIELLEADDYQSMPEPVFIKGYLRAYAKLLETSAEPLIKIFDRVYSPSEEPEKAMWHTRSEKNKTESLMQWLTGFVVIGVLVAVVLWWHNNKNNTPIMPVVVSHQQEKANASEPEIRLTDLSAMRSLLSTENQFSQVRLEKSSE